MQILTNQSSTWLSTEIDAERDKAHNEINRILSDCFRCNNLVILTGLGTSLHINLDKNLTLEKRTRTALVGKKIAPTMATLWNKASEKSGSIFSKVLAISKFPQETLGDNIEALLSFCKIAGDFIDDEPNKKVISKFIDDTEEIIRDEVDFLDTDDDLRTHSELLRRVVRRSSRKVRTKIFTTNYDLCFEYAARHGRYTVIDGFSHTQPQVFDSIFYSYDIVKRDSFPDSHDFIPNVFHLYKLHGSIDWTKNEDSNELERQSKTKKPVLVYPRNTKYELAFEQPYLEMMSAFQNAIRQPETGLLIVGFGFNDNHLAGPILSAIKSNLSLKVVICDPSLAPVLETHNEGNASKHPHISQIKYLIENGDARLSMINATFEELVPMLPDIAALTDLEQHFERVRMLKGHKNVE